MSIFYNLAGFRRYRHDNQAKIAVMLASMVASVTGYLWLKSNLRIPITEEE